MSILIIRADARDLPLPDASTDLIVTSPPYFGLRDYRDGDGSLAGQIGSEPAPQAYIASLISCTREWVRVLKPSGSIFVNLGDKYGRGTRTTVNGTAPKNHPGPEHVVRTGHDKSLLGLPWRYALACTDQLGLILRAEIIWAKPNGLPESVTDRVRRSHEQFFHLVKQPRYYAAVDEIRESHAAWTLKAYAYEQAARARNGTGYNRRTNTDRNDEGDAGDYAIANPLGKLPGSVWKVASQPLTVPPELGIDHFAAFPMELPRRLILGWSPPGICTECGEGRRPVTSIDHERGWTRRTDGSRNGNRHAGEGAGQIVNNRQIATITGYACACTPYTDHPERRGKDFHQQQTRGERGANDGNGGERYRRYVEELANPRGPVREHHFDQWLPAPTRPAVVLDPFGGTGTTALLADVLGRTGISIDRSADYCRLARWRTTDPGERARAMQVPKPAPVMTGQETLF